MSAIEVKALFKGGIFTKEIEPLVQKQITHEVIEKLEERMTRKGTQGSGGRGLGVQRNVVTAERKGFAVLEVKSTVGGKEHWPRTTGSKWQGKNIGIIRSMSPRLVNAAARRIVEELGQ